MTNIRRPKTPNVGEDLEEPEFLRTAGGTETGENSRPTNTAPFKPFWEKFLVEDEELCRSYKDLFYWNKRQSRVSWLLWAWDLSALGIKQFLPLETLNAADSSCRTLKGILGLWWDIKKKFSRCLTTSSCFLSCTAALQERPGSMAELIGRLYFNFRRQGMDRALEWMTRLLAVFQHVMLLCLRPLLVLHPEVQSWAEPSWAGLSWAELGWARTGTWILGLIDKIKSQQLMGLG